MKVKALIVTVALLATATGAMARPSTLAMSCGQAAGIVASAGGIVLGTGGYTYDRFVTHGGFCLRGEIEEPAWVPTFDTPQCFVGYRCRERMHKRS
jgi:hypothetical protein